VLHTRLLLAAGPAPLGGLGATPHEHWKLHVVSHLRRASRHYQINETER